ncbi:hypothetical protein ONZ43_g636 [Nemania bipapillata]|uniref:Uncharacterized protein n=1 Tax=Nemania bipapillata TaxID=110536 RepID=A0ACC2J7C7_9PEZI|nr:hypothetical protein ONZ43_g636 [Nemania bipapillata]
MRATKFPALPRFSYTITRDYPYAWVTPAVILGGIVAITFVTIINVATIGFDLVATSTNNPNQTLHDANPYGHHGLLSLLARGVKASCTATTLPINIQMFTTNYAIPYTLSSVWRENEDNTQENLGSLVYMNQPINCTVTEVIIQVLGKYTQTPILTARSRVGLLLKTHATCSVDLGNRPSASSVAKRLTYFNLIGSYNLLDETIPHFLLRNETDKASLFWGESLLSVYSLITAGAYHEEASVFSWGQDGTYNAYIGLTRQSNATTGSAEEVTSDEFFHVQCFTEANYCGNHTIPWLSQGKGVDGHAFDPYASIWGTIDILGKAMWFTVMTDLGQNDNAIPNMLAYPDLLANLTRNLTTVVQYWESPEATGNITGSTIGIDHTLSTKSFDPSTAPQPALGAEPAFLSTDYICQVPRSKSPGIRLLLILMSDIVFLQTIWSIFKLILDYKVGRDGHNSRHCEGCLETHIQESAAPVGPAGATTITNRKPYIGRKSIDESDVEMVSYEQINVTERHVS